MHLTISLKDIQFCVIFRTVQIQRDGTVLNFFPEPTGILLCIY